MSNEDLPRSAESASAYLDDELAATERASAAADPEVLATVESFTRVRAALSDVEPVADSTKASALAAALAEFDALRAPASRTATPTVISLQSRRLRAYRVVMGVAAAAVVVVAIAALGSAGGNDAKSSSSATQPPTAAAEALPQLKVAADTAAPAATAAAAAGGNAFPQSSEATLPAIDTREELQQFAASVESGDIAATSPAPAGTAAPAAVEAPADGGTFAQLACINSDQTVLGDISYQGTPAYAVRNTTSGALQALDATDCHVLDEVPAP